MIFDSIHKLSKYSNVPYISEILKFLKETNIKELSEGDIPIKQEELFVKVLHYTPKDATENYFETHDYYADLQMIVSGQETIHVVDNQYLKETDEFSLEGDFTFYKADQKITELVLEQDKFAIFFPGEPHKPGCTYNNVKEPVMKLVFKIKM
jgi:biofilm protein TabA